MRRHELQENDLSRREAVKLLMMASGGLMLGAAAASPSPLVAREIPSSGESLPVIGLGTWQTFDVGASETAPLQRVLSTFVARGGTLVDSSPMYGRSEEVLGDLAAKLSLHRSLFVATKVWTSGKSAGIRQMEASERKLHTKKIDLMQVHNLVDFDTHLPTLRAWKESGRIRYIGITHYHSAAYEEVERVLRRERLDFLQINYSVAERDAENRILPLARERGVAVIVNRPFAGGAIFGRVRGRQLPTFAAEIGCTSWAQLFLKFILGHPAVTCAIPATDDPKHLEDNMTAGRGPMPDAGMRKKILAAVDAR
jgi:diketogulonate reductase-like aldo/keto reductase